MSDSRCEHVQDRLAELGTAALASDADDRAHVESCEECRAVLFALQELDAALAMMPPVEPPPALVSRIAEHVAGLPHAVPAPTEAAPSEAAESAPAAQEPDVPDEPDDEAILGVGPRIARWLRRALVGNPARAWALGLATVVLAGLVGVISLSSGSGDDYRSGAANVALDTERSRGPRSQVAQELAEVLPPEPDDGEMSNARGLTRTSASTSGSTSRSAEGGRYWNQSELEVDEEEGEEVALRALARPEAPPVSTPVATPAPPPRPVDLSVTSMGWTGDDGIEDAVRFGDLTLEEPRLLGELEPEPRPEPEPREVQAPLREQQSVISRLYADGDDDETEDYRESARTEAARDLARSPYATATIDGAGNEPQGGEARGHGDGFARLDPGYVDLADEASGGDIAGNADSWGDRNGTPGGRAGQGQLGGSDPARVARGFLDARRAVDGLRFVDPSGYWANTYVPGDPVLRELQRRLGGSGAGPSEGASFALADRARTYSQPFDVPDDASLAVFLASDRRNVQGETRALVQVGIQGSERETGRRPTMNVGVVLDLTAGADEADRAAIAALLEALSEANEVGDRFSLTVAGHAGATLIEPGRFGYGEVLVARESLWGAEATPAGAGPTLEEAYEMAATMVAASDDPDAVLGSSLVLVVTPGALGHRLDGLARLAHRTAVAGIPTSVVGVGDGVAVAELDALALSGQGNRRLLRDASAAQTVVADELAAAGRVIARALRLRIRLAPGVRLVNVLGSHRLGEGAAERVREAENAIDQRLARSLGIEADRGEDEDGIQIVIPAFYADDTHVILLDVVTQGAGPVADVSVRYKDLVHLRNGVATAHLSLGNGEDEPGPLQINVLKNLLAFELARALADAGDLVRSGDGRAAAARLAAVHTLIRGMQDEVPSFEADPEVLTDLEMTAAYLAVIEDGRLGGLTSALADSLLYASRLKLLTPNESEGTDD